MRRAAEDGAGAVLHENEIGDVDGKLGAGDDWMFHAQARVVSPLLLRLDLCRARAVVLAFGDEGRGLGVARRDRLRQWMIRREAQEARTEQRVRPRGEHLYDVLAFWRALRHLEADQQSFRAADPVRLHEAHLLRPAVERLKCIEQVLRIVGDLEHPLRLLALLDERAGAPASAVDHLLIREHCLVYRIPVHFALLAVDEPR